MHLFKFIIIIMLIISKLSRKAQSLIYKPQQGIGLGKAILHYIRTVMNRIRWEQNRQLNSLQTRNTNVPKSVEQANKLFIATERDISLNQKARMQRIDNILGTNTYYQDVKPYQERLDSDHIMDLGELKKIHKEPSRKVLNWLNPKADTQLFKYKNKRKHYQHISKLRTYPQHQAKKYDFADQKNENTINFLGKQAVYSKISLKPIQLTIESMQKQVIGVPGQKAFFSEKYAYFRPALTMQYFRIQKTFFNNSIITDDKVFHSQQNHIQEIISLDQIYEILKEYDTDQRVSEYLAKIQNNRLEYFFSQFNYDKHENIIAIVIDLLGNNKEYCLIVKNITSKQYKPIPLFNIRPQVIFSQDGKYISYVQRSPQGGWIQLVYRTVQSCWKKQGDLVLAEEDQIMYRCEPQQELSIGTDSNKNYIFLTIKQYNRQFSESLFIIHKLQENALSLIQLDKGSNCKYYYDVCPLGIIYSKFTQAHSSYLKYGKNSKIATSIQLIPYKQHIQIHHQDKPGINDGLLPYSPATNNVPPPTQFDVNNKKTIYSAGQFQFIKQIQTRSTHLIISLNLQSTYNKSILYFLPFKSNAHPHSIILGGGNYIQLAAHSYSYNSQVVQFQKPNGLLLTEKIYNIWKKQLIDGSEDHKRYNYQKITINQDQYGFEVPLLYRSLYNNEQLPVLIYFASRNQDIEPTALRQFLQKGVMIVQFKGRGTFTQDLQHYLHGSRHNFTNMLDDLQQLIEFIGNNMTKNISLYCKGEISSLVGLCFNIYFPYLFNSTILHNGIYDLEDQVEMEKFKDFFGKEKWDHFNAFKHQFKQPTRQRQENSQLIGTLQNIIISSDQNHRIQSRKLIHKLRQNSAFRYNQVYLKEFENEYQTDLYNLSYFYSLMRRRMQQQINDPQHDL